MGDAAIAPGTLLAAAHDAGGANAIAPVVQQWIALGRAAHALVSGPAVRIFEERRLPSTTLSREAAAMPALRRAAAGVLDRERPDVVLAGTSWEPAIDKACISEAAARSVPSLAVVDALGWYRERFGDVDGGDDDLRYLPDRVAVMSDAARRDAERAGVPALRLVVTGQPHFDDFRVRAAARGLDATRLRRGVDAGRPIVVFASERIGADFAVGTRRYRGYDERDVWAGLRAAAGRLDSPVTLVAKLHPQEDPWNPDGDCVVWRDVPAAAAALAADVVVGMTSTFLLEAALVGKPTISFQPGAQPATDNVSLQLGLTRLARTDRELEAALRDAFEGRLQPATLPEWTGTASARVVDELLALMAAKAAIR